MVFPQAAETTAACGQHNFVPGRIRLCKRRIIASETIDFTIQETVVDIDASYIDFCGIFPPNVAALLKKFFLDMEQNNKWHVENIVDVFEARLVVGTSPSDLADQGSKARLCSRCRSTYNPAHTVPHLYFEKNGQWHIAYCCLMCQTNKLGKTNKKSKTVDLPNNWDATMKEKWPYFIAYHKYIMGSNVNAVQDFFAANFVGLMEGDSTTFSSFNKKFPKPPATNRKRAKTSAD